MSVVSWREVSRCRGCHGDAGDFVEVLRLDPMPLAGQFCKSREEALSAEVFPLTWVQCRRCDLVQVLEDVDDRALYTEYNYASSTVPGLVRHFEAFAASLRAALEGIARPRVLEIGCNDGVLLRRLPEHWERVGVDPSDVARRAEPRSYELVPRPFSSALGAELARAGRKFDLISASNCLAHISDLRDVFEGITSLLADHGRLVVEVHHLDDLLSTGQWDTIYHEHKAEWSPRSLARCLKLVGLGLERIERLPLHGGLLRAWFSREGRGASVELGDPEAEARGFVALREAYTRRRDLPVYRRLRELLADKRRLGAYGASGRANVWFNQHPELEFDFVVDDSPARVGRFIPRTALPIVPAKTLFDRQPAACLITAWNYAADIKNKSAAYRGEWCVAIGG